MAKKNKNLLKDLVKISKYFGQRFDLTQAAGGNSSIKLGNQMYIKSSGYSLSEVSLDNGYTLLDNDKLIDFLNKIKPEIIIHLVAITKVDFCEENFNKAHEINFLTTKNLVDWSEKKKIRFIYLIPL